MNKQMTLSTMTDELAQARTRKKEFLEQMNRIIPWGEWIGIIKPHYYKGERGNKPYELETRKHRRFQHHSGVQFDKKPGKETGQGCAPDQEGQHVVFRL